MEMVKYYKNPFQVTRILLSEKTINWIFPLKIYLITYLFINLLSFFNLLIFNMDGFYKVWYKILISTLPFIVFYSITGKLFFRSECDKIKTHFQLSILHISYAFLIVSVIRMIWHGVLIHLNIKPSSLIAGVFFLTFILISKLIFNCKIYRGEFRYIFGKSLIEMIITFILSMLFMGGLTSI